MKTNLKLGTLILIKTLNENEDYTTFTTPEMINNSDCYATVDHIYNSGCVSIKNDNNYEAYSIDMFDIILLNPRIESEVQEDELYMSINTPDGGWQATTCQLNINAIKRAEKWLLGFIDPDYTLIKLSEYCCNQDCNYNYNNYFDFLLYCNKRSQLAIK